MNYNHPGYKKPYPITTVLRDLASQEGCDGEPYDVMIAAAGEIDRLTAELTALRAGQDALVAAAHEAAAQVFDGSHRALREIDLLPHGKPSSFSEIAAILRALTPADATAALDAKLRVERNKALRDAADQFDDGVQLGNPKAAILAMIEPEGK